MSDKKDDHLYRSSFAIPVDNKTELDDLIKHLKLDSMTDLLNMLASDRPGAVQQLEGIAAGYRRDKLTKRDLERKIREQQRLRAKLQALEGKP